jgi:hypothetical protein
MEMGSQKNLINLTGWGVFLAALVVYVLTMAPTASFWDCGEFIACANELEVTHPPGAPLFLLLGRLFAMWAGPSDVAWMVNLLSVLSGAFTALFTAWITIALARKGLEKSGFEDPFRLYAALAAGVIAGLTCTFADSIWFNSVEAEVYSMSSFFTALVVWLMVKWEARADEPDHLRWIILIAYVMGLSTGVHLLNLLTIPGLALVYYFRKYPFSIGGFSLTLLISLAILAGIQYGILQYSISAAWGLEKWLTGTLTREGTNPTGLGLPFGTGTFVFVALLTSVLAGLIFWSQRKQWVVVNVAALSVLMVFLGFSSYSTIYIRSNANPAIDMNNPENILTFLAYMRREQYGERPLVRGPMYNALPERDAQGYPKFENLGKKYILQPGADRYVEDVEDQKYAYAAKDKVWFPRMWEPGHYQAGPYGYIEFVKRKGKDRESPYDDKPTRGEDLRFFFEYQLSHMYFRYFMWNFAGRNSDIQDDGYPTLASALSKDYVSLEVLNNKSRNNYFWLPLLLGLLGAVWHGFSRGKDALVVAALFVLTGIAIIVYLNQYPLQPRERDYSYAGSFQVFAIWVGLGTLFLAELFQRFLRRLAVPVSFALALVPVGLMATQNWDDHTRKGRFIDTEFAKNLLDSCEENAILFTGGDNDTFPLWYVQEVEGYRTDVRVCNLELLISDWYIDQMREKRNESEPLPITMDRTTYLGEKGRVIYDVAPIQMQFPLDKAALVKNGILNEKEAALAADTMTWTFPVRGSSRNSYVLLKDSVMLNMIRNIAADGWKRPVYFANTMPASNFIGLDAFLRLEGLAYRLVPLERSELTTNDLYYGTISQDRMKKLMMEQYKYSGLSDPSVHFDEHIRQVIINNYRTTLFRWANTYIEAYFRAEKTADTTALALNRAEFERIMRFSEEKIPHAVVPTPVNLLISQAQVADRMNLDSLAVRYIADLKPLILDGLRVEKERKIRPDQNSMSIRGAMVTLSYLLKHQRMDELMAFGAELEKITGLNFTENLLQENQPGSSPSNP